MLIALLAIAVVAWIGMALSLRLRLSHWWLLGLGGTATILALSVTPPVSACAGGSLRGDLFAISVILALGLYGAVAAAVLINPMSLRLGPRLGALAAAAGLAFVTFIPVVHHLEDCLA